MKQEVNLTISLKSGKDWPVKGIVETDSFRFAHLFRKANKSKSVLVDCGSGDGPRIRASDIVKHSAQKALVEAEPTVQMCRTRLFLSRIPDSSAKPELRAVLFGFRNKDAIGLDRTSFGCIVAFLPRVLGAFPTVVRLKIFLDEEKLYARFLVVVLAGCASLLSAQQPKVLAPHKPIPPRVPESLVQISPEIHGSHSAKSWIIGVTVCIAG